MSPKLGIPNKTLRSYLHTFNKWVPDNLIIHIDDRNIIKLDGYKSETLGYGAR